MRIAATQPDVANTTMIKRARVAKRRDGRTTAASLEQGDKKAAADGWGYKV